jgi:hypothetical protein
VSTRGPRPSPHSVFTLRTPIEKGFEHTMSHIIITYGNILRSHLSLNITSSTSRIRRGRFWGYFLAVIFAVLTGATVSSGSGIPRPND